MSAKTTPLAGLLTVDDCAKLLQCSVTLVETYIKAGRLRRVSLTSREVGAAQRGPKNWRIRPESLAEFIASLEGFETPREPKGGSGAPPRTNLPKATGTDGKSRAKLPRPR